MILGDRLEAITRDDGKIGGGESEGEEIGRGDPAEGDVLVRLRRGRVGREAADEGKHLDDDGAVVVREAREGADDLGGAAEFLAEFAEECGLGGLTGLNLAAGKFPFQREVLVRGALGDEHAATSVLDDGGDDGNGNAQLQHVPTNDAVPVRGKARRVLGRGRPVARQCASLRRRKSGSDIGE